VFSPHRFSHEAIIGHTKHPGNTAADSLRSGGHLRVANVSYSKSFSLHHRALLRLAQLLPTSQSKSSEPILLLSGSRSSFLFPPLKGAFGFHGQLRRFSLNLPCSTLYDFGRQRPCTRFGRGPASEQHSQHRVHMLGLNLLFKPCTPYSAGTLVRDRLLLQRCRSEC
jgi:hypothetical protein